MEQEIKRIIHLFREGLNNPGKPDHLWCSYADAMVFLAETLKTKNKNFNEEEFYRECGVEN
ncbi:MAG: hypothetical protein KGO96_07100 [Elusimicrobia bacterium]|nr:hypothetical protein [Elusimicrobiota bacterium]